MGQYLQILLGRAFDYFFKDALTCLNCSLLAFQKFTQLLQRFFLLELKDKPTQLSGQRDVLCSAFDLLFF